MANGQPTISDLSSCPHVLEAIAEFDRLGRGEFLAHYGYGPSLRYRLHDEGKLL